VDPQERVTYDLLFVIDLASRCVHLAGCATNPTADRMKQIARNLTDPLDGFLRDKRYLLMDRDSKYSEAFRHLLEQAGVHCVRLPARSPNLTPHIERFMRTIKEECLDRMILFGENSLQKATLELNGGKPIRRSAERRKRLAAMQKKVDPNTLRAIDALDLTDSDSPDNS
jgi:hypothetical protein